MRRGDLVTVAANGDYGKPRPALVIQSDYLPETDSVLVCLITSTLRAAPLYRLDLLANGDTGLQRPSQLMTDKIIAVRRDRCGPPIGRLSDDLMAQATRLLVFAIGANG